MPIAGFTPEEEATCRSLAMYQIEAYARWGAANDPRPTMRRVFKQLLREIRTKSLTADTLGDFWVVQARAIRDYMHDSEQEMLKTVLSVPTPKETIQ